MDTGTVEQQSGMVTTTTESGSVTSQQTPAAEVAQPQQIWDSPDNPFRKFRDSYAGLNGNFKQVQGELAQTKAQLAQLQVQQVQVQKEREEHQRVASKENIKQMLSGDPYELQKQLTQIFQENEIAEAQATQLREKITPVIYNDAYQQAKRAIHGEYEQGAFQIAEINGVTQEEVVKIAQESGGDFAKFWNLFADQIATKKGSGKTKDMDELMKKIQALETEVNAQRRAGEGSPDATPGQVSTGPRAFKSRAEIDVAYLNGEFADATTRNKHGGVARNKYVEELGKLGFTP